ASSVLHRIDQRAAAIRLAGSLQAIRERVVDLDRRARQCRVLVAGAAVENGEPGLGDANAFGLGPYGERFLLCAIGHASRLGSCDQLSPRLTERRVALTNTLRQGVDPLAGLETCGERIADSLFRRIRNTRDQPCGLALSVIKQPRLEHLPRDAELGGKTLHRGLTSRGQERGDDLEPCGLGRA